MGQPCRNPARVTERALACSPSPALRVWGVRTNIIPARLILDLLVGFPPSWRHRSEGNVFSFLATMAPSTMQMNNTCFAGKGVICWCFQKVWRKPIKMLMIWLTEGKVRRDIRFLFLDGKSTICKVRCWSQGRHVFRWQVALRARGTAKGWGWRTRRELECGKYKRENYPNCIDTREGGGGWLLGSLYSWKPLSSCWVLVKWIQPWT